MSFLLSILLLLAPVKAEHARFNISKDGRKIGTEEFTIGKKGSNYSLEGKATIGDVAISSNMELDEKLVPISYEVANQAGKIRITVAQPTSQIQTAVGKDTSSTDFRFPAGAAILDNNLFHHYVILLYRAQMGETTIPVVVPQDMSIGSAVVRSTGPRSYELQVGDIKMQATTDADGSLIKLTIPGANVVVER
jgi:hypothetical protein